MGVNGSGKTTILHALACAYKPREGSKCVSHSFREFFVTNTDSLWQGSSFEIINETTDNRNGVQEHVRQYSKDKDRWKPRSRNRPTRNVYYIGIETCLPDIEIIKTKSRVNYSKHLKKDKISCEIIGLARKILNMDYSALLENETDKRVLPGVARDSGLTYSSLSMGSGEQRILKILDTVLRAESNSLILIDEIDVLLHVSALNNLLNVLKSIAKSKDRQLQIVFTTHSLEIQRHSKDIGIQYISKVYGSEDARGIPLYVVHKTINSDIIHDLTNDRVCPATIYVEDELACTVVRSLLAKHGMRNKTNVVSFGAASNAFTLAASPALENKDTANILILLDGDVYRTESEKMEQIRHAISGSKDEDKKKREKAVSLISQFNLPEGMNPERFLYDLLMKYGAEDSDILREAQRITSVEDNHEWINNIASALGEDVPSIVGEVIAKVKDTQEWKNYVSPVESWITARTDI